MRRMSLTLGLLAAAGGLASLYLAFNGQGDYFLIGRSFDWLTAAGVLFFVGASLSHQRWYAGAALCVAIAAFLLGQMRPEERIPVIVALLCGPVLFIVALEKIFGYRVKFLRRLIRPRRSQSGT